MPEYNGYWSDPELRSLRAHLAIRFGSHDKSTDPDYFNGDANFTFTVSGGKATISFEEGGDNLQVGFADASKARLVKPVSWGKLYLEMGSDVDESQVEEAVRPWFRSVRFDEVMRDGKAWEVYVLNATPSPQSPNVFSVLAVDLPRTVEVSAQVLGMSLRSMTARSHLRSKLIRLAHENSKLRPRILQLLRTAAEPSYQDYVERKKKDGETPLDKKEWEAKVLNKGKGKDDSEGKADEASIKKSQTALRNLYKPLDAVEESFEAALKDAGLADHEVKAELKKMKAEAEKVRSKSMDVYFDATDGKDITNDMDGIKKEIDDLLSGPFSKDKIKARVKELADKKKKDSDETDERAKKRREENAPKVKALPSKVKAMFSSDEDLEEVFDAMPEKMFDKNEGRSAPHTKKAIEALKGKLSAGEASALRAKAEKVYYDVLDEMKVVDPGDESKEGDAAYGALHKAQNTWRVFSQLEQEAEDDPESFKGGGKKASTSPLRAKLIRLAHARPDLRKKLLPLLSITAGTYQDYVERKKKKGENPLDKDAWEARTQGKGKGKGKGDEGKGKPEPKEESREEYQKRFIQENAEGRKAFPSKMKSLYGGGGHLSEVFDSSPDEFSSKNEADRAKHVADTVKSLKSKLTVGEAKKLAQESEEAFNQALKAFGSSFMHGESTKEGSEAEKQYFKAQNTLSVFRELGRMTKSNPKSFKGGKDDKGGKKASTTPLRSKLIRLAYENPALRKKLIPLINRDE